MGDLRLKNVDFRRANQFVRCVGNEGDRNTRCFVVLEGFGYSK